MRDTDWKNDYIRVRHGNIKFCFVWSSYSLLKQDTSWT